MSKHAFSFLLMSIIVILLVGMIGPVSAQSISHDPPPPESEDWGTQDYLLIMPLPNSGTLGLDAKSLSSGISPQYAREYARIWVQRNAERYRRSLSKLRSLGVISSFQIKPDLNAILLRGVVDPRALQALVKEFKEVIIEPAQTASVCARTQGQRLPAQIMAIGQFLSNPVNASEKTNAAAAPPVPTIDINITPIYNEYDNVVSGKAAANSEVVVRVLRGATEVYNLVTISDSKGFYAVWPGYNCDTGVATPLLFGDVIEVTSSGQVATTVLVDINAYVDPNNDIVGGSTQPLRRVQIDLYHATTLCRSRKYTQFDIAGPVFGEFFYLFGGSLNFNGLSWAVIYSRDVNGNSTSIVVHAYHIAYAVDSPTISGTAKANLPVNASLKRGGATVSTKDGTADKVGNFELAFDQSVQPGDIVEVNSDGLIQTSTAANLVNVDLSIARNRISGQTAPGTLVQAFFFGLGYGSCREANTCVSRISNPITGQFTIAAGFDIKRGDMAELILIDAAGNEQRGFWQYAPLLIADPMFREVWGFWKANQANLTAQLRRTGTLIQEVGPGDILFDEGYFSVLFNYPLRPGDIVEITDGTLTERMSVSDLSARLDAAKKKLMGVASRGSILARYWDFNPQTDTEKAYCQLSTVRGGAYQFIFKGAAIGPGDQAVVSNIGQDTHITSTLSRAFGIFTLLNDSQVTVNTMGAADAVTVQLLSAVGNLIEEHSDTAKYGEISFDFAADFTAGQSLLVVTPDVARVVPVPVLTIDAVNPVDNTVAGQAPAGEPVFATLTKISQDPYSGQLQMQVVRVQALTDATGNYLADFDGNFLGFPPCVFPARVDNGDLDVTYYTFAGDAFTLEN